MSPIDRLSDRLKTTLGLSSSIVLSGRILLVEDGVDNQYLISVYLRWAGADVDVAENGRIAREKLRAAGNTERPYDLLISNLQMPETDGYALAKTLRADGHQIPIVALTAHAMAEDRIRCLNAGCNDYATKPINKAELIATCSRWMNASAFVEPKKQSALDSNINAGTAHVAQSGLLVSELADDPDIGPLIGKFLTSLRTKVTRMSECLLESRLKELEMLAHQLSGACGGYGFPTMSDAARRVEHSIKEDPALGQIQSAMQELSSLCQKAIAGGSPSNEVAELEQIREPQS